MTRAPGRGASTGAPGGVLLALAAAATFSLSGPFATALMNAGWSPGGAALVRTGGAAAVLLVPTLLTLRGRWRLLARNGKLIAAYGIVVVNGGQLCLFNAFQHVSVGVALLIEYLAPVMMVAAVWLSSRRRPGAMTMIGAGLSIVGLIFVLDLTGQIAVSPVGIAWALGAALSLAGYYVMSARVGDTLPPMVLAGGGLAVGAVSIAMIGFTGLLPLRYSAQPVVLLGWQTNWLIPTIVLVLVSTAFAYVIGIAATGRLGTRVASFLGMSEVLFAVLFAWILLGQLPTLIQLTGGVGIIVGVILVRADRYRAIPFVPARVRRRPFRQWLRRPPRETGQLRPSPEPSRRRSKAVRTPR
ncbi:MAG: EamA family transporter [Microbacteriaceae bacterium]